MVLSPPRSLHTLLHGSQAQGGAAAGTSLEAVVLSHHSRYRSLACALRSPRHDVLLLLLLVLLLLLRRRRRRLPAAPGAGAGRARCRCRCRSLPPAAADPRAGCPLVPRARPSAARARAEGEGALARRRQPRLLREPLEGEGGGERHGGCVDVRTEARLRRVLGVAREGPAPRAPARAALDAPTPQRERTLTPCPALTESSMPRALLPSLPPSFLPPRRLDHGLLKGREVDAALKAVQRAAK